VHASYTVPAYVGTDQNAGAESSRITHAHWTCSDPALTDRIWVLLSEASNGGWGLAGHANTNAELIAAARAQIAQLPATQSETTSD
jgi:hypothetical protein